MTKEINKTFPKNTTYCGDPALGSFGETVKIENQNDVPRCRCSFSGQCRFEAGTVKSLVSNS